MVCYVGSRCICCRCFGGGVWLTALCWLLMVA